MNKRHGTWVIIIVAIGTTTVPGFLIVELMPQLSFGTIAVQGPERRVALAVSSDDIYIAWITNKTGNDQVMFRSSNDAGATFNDIIILSNTTNATLQIIRVSAGADNVIVTWWQTNSTNEEPVYRISTDDGQTFTALLNLAANGTITLIQ
jgi:hypothetical protein